MKKRATLKFQVILIFSLVSIITAIVFLVVLERQSESMYIDQDRKQQQIFMLNVVEHVGLQTQDKEDKHYGYVILKDRVVVDSYNVELISDSYSQVEVVNKMPIGLLGIIDEEGINNIYFKGTSRDINGNLVQVITFSNGSYQREYRLETTFSVRFAFLSIILLGNVIIVLWATLLVDRINILKLQVSTLSAHNFKTPIKSDGHDEVGDLSRAIEAMRISIAKNNETKNEMLQNISHDIKTPIAVIKSYAEAIYDGVSDLEDIKVIIKQTDMLNRKVRQLLEFNKLEHIKDQRNFKDISLRPLLEQIIEQNKYRTKAQFIFEADNSSYYGIYENLHTVFSNLIDNAIRYALNEIRITVNKKRVTVYNDGEPIDEKFIKEGFNPYEKGSKGQFGLGLSIVYKTLTHFNLKIEVKNVNNGVLFTIEPLL